MMLGSLLKARIPKYRLRVPGYGNSPKRNQRTASSATRFRSLLSPWSRIFVRVALEQQHCGS